MIINITKLKERRLNVAFAIFNSMLVALMLSLGTMRLVEHSYVFAALDYALALINLGCVFAHIKQMVKAGVFISE